MSAATWGEPLPTPAVRQLLRGIADGFRSVNATIDQILWTSEGSPRADHRHAPDEPCPRLYGDRYPARWTECEERAWRAIDDEYPEGTFSQEPPLAEEVGR